MYHDSKKLPSRRRLVISAIVGVALLAVLISALELTNTTHIFHSSTTKNPEVAAGQSTKGEPADSSTGKTTPSQPTDTNTAEPGDDKNNSTTGADLVEPSGTFVSAHKNVPANAALSSVCNTTSGATCQIIFTSGSATKSLPAQTTDRGGATFWNSWTPASIGLTSGTWQVKATSSLGGQTKTSTDALALEIQ